MEARSKMKNQGGLQTWRTGNARLSGVLLGLGALLAAGVACYAMWGLVNPASGVRGGEVIEAGDGIDEPGGDGGGVGIAATESIEEILGAVQVYVRNQQFAQATTVLEHAAAQYPADQDIHLALGDLYMMQNRHSDAYGQYVSGIEIGPSTAVAEMTAGTLANMLGFVELAEAHYQNSMRMDPSNPDTPIYLAAIQLKLNRLDDAKRNLAHAGRLAPDRAKVFVMRCEIAMRENKPMIALDQIRKARQLEPNELAWIVQEARVLKRARKAQEAIDLLTALGQEQLEEPEVVMVLAQCLGMVGRPGDAASRLMDSANANPKDADLCFEVALWLERAGERASAIEWANKAYTLGYERALGWVESLAAP